MQVLIDPPEKLYDEEYVNKIVNKKDWRYKQIPRQVEVLWEFFTPSSVLDIGASNGLHLEAFNKKGVGIFGIEGTIHFAEHLEKRLGSNSYLIRDIRMPFDLKKKFDLVCCIEILEHIEQEYVGIAMDNIVRHGDKFFITASDISNNRYHINAHELNYWVEQFKARGLIYSQRATREIRERFEDADIESPWYQDNSMVFYSR